MLATQMVLLTNPFPTILEAVLLKRPPVRFHRYQQGTRGIHRGNRMAPILFDSETTSAIHFFPQNPGARSVKFSTRPPNESRPSNKCAPSFQDGAAIALGSLRAAGAVQDSEPQAAGGFEAPGLGGEFRIHGFLLFFRVRPEGTTQNSHLAVCLRSTFFACIQSSSSGYMPVHTCSLFEIRSSVCVCVRSDRITLSPTF